MLKTILEAYEMVKRRQVLRATTSVLTRFLFYKTVFDRIKDVDGDIVECGVGEGHTLYLLSFLAQCEKKHRRIWGFDSFEGFPPPSPYDRAKQGEWKVGINETLQFLYSYLDRTYVNTKVTLIKGRFEDTLKDYDGKIALLHLDCDLYASYLTALKKLEPRLNSGGAIIFDEYRKTADMLNYPGARRAVDEYFKGEKMLQDETSGRHYWIKARGIENG